VSQPSGAHTHPELQAILDAAQEILAIVRPLPDWMDHVDARLERIEEHLRRITPNGHHQP